MKLPIRNAFYLFFCNRPFDSRSPESALIAVHRQTTLLIFIEHRSFYALLNPLRATAPPIALLSDLVAHSTANLRPTRKIHLPRLASPTSLASASGHRLFQASSPESSVVSLADGPSAATARSDRFVGPRQPVRQAIAGGFLDRNIGPNFQISTV